MGSPKIRIVSLGCAKNDVDSEEIAGVLSSSGYQVDGSSKSPDVTIINTCGFLEASKQESIEAIKKAVRSRGQGKVIVAGCLAQRLGDELARVAPGADAYVGVGQMGRFQSIVESTLRTREPMIALEPPQHRWADVKTRSRSGKAWSAYLKISEGCDHRCTFCTIPSFRGPHVSKPLERVLEEAHYLASTGAIELNLIAQDITQYGFDIYRKFTLPKLLQELNKIESVEWIRLLYFYPNRLTDEVIQTMSESVRVLPYVDIPLQHVHPATLKRMHRPWNGERYLALFDKLRASMPHVCIRSTFIVGFPGETEEEFQYLLDFIQTAKLDRVGAFLYSRETGTPSHDMPGQVPFRVKKDRFDRLMMLQQRISLEKNHHWIGQQLDVLVEESHRRGSIGRSFRDAPEIDGIVSLEGEHQLGKIVTATMQSANEYDLNGTVLGVPSNGNREGQPASKVKEPAQST